MNDGCRHPLVSVGIPTSNGDQTIERAISSVLAQTYTALEVVISINASRDSTEDVCRRCQERDPRIKVIRQPEKVSAAANREEVFRGAAGDFFMWLADDEWLDANYVMACVEILSEYPAYGLVAGRSVYDQENGHSETGEMVVLDDDDVCERIYGYYSSVIKNGLFCGVYKRSVLTKVGPNLLIDGEWLFVDRVCRVSKARTVESATIHRTFKKGIHAGYLSRAARTTALATVFPYTVFAWKVFADICVAARNKELSCRKRLTCASRVSLLLLKRFIRYDVVNAKKALGFVAHSLSLVSWLRRMVFLFKSTIGFCLDRLGSDREKPGFEHMAFFSPLPPIRSGISSYSEYLLNELVKYYNVDVFVDFHYGETPRGRNGYGLYGQIWFRVLNALKRYKYAVYQIGSSEYHKYMYPVIKRTGGVVVLHDGMNFLYRRDKAALLSRSTVIVHNEPSYREVLNGGVTARTFEIPQIMPQRLSLKDLEQEKMMIRHSMGISDDVLVIGAFGIVSPAKNVGSALAAVRASFSEKDEFIFIVAGYQLLDAQVSSFFEQNKNDARYLLRTDLTSDAFNNYIMATDLCFNLRYPFYGETSSSLLRIMSYGVASIVTDIGSFSDLPDDCVIKTSRGIVLDEYIKILRRAKNNRGWLHTLGMNAYNYVKDYHNAEAVCKRYVEIIGGSR